MKIVYLDIETTGLNPITDQILEIGLLVDDLTLSDDVPKASYHKYILHDRLSGDPYALALNAKIIEKIATAKLPNIDFIQLKDLAADLRVFLQPIPGPITIGGKNVAGFDFQFLKRVPNIDGIGGGLRIYEIRLSQRTVDPGMLYFFPVFDKGIPNLNECLRRAEIDATTDHTALGDCRLVSRLVRTYYSKEFNVSDLQPTSS